MTNEHRRDLLIITIIIVFTLRTSLILLHSITLTGVSKLAVVNVVAACRINILEVVPLLMYIFIYIRKYIHTHKNCPHGTHGT